MVRFNWKKLILTYLLIFAVQIVLTYFLAKMNIPSLYRAILIDLTMAILLTVINYPRLLRKYCLKDKYFYRNIAIFFLIFFAFDFFLGW